MVYKCVVCMTYTWRRPPYNKCKWCSPANRRGACNKKKIMPSPPRRKRLRRKTSLGAVASSRAASSSSSSSASMAARTPTASCRKPSSPSVPVAPKAAVATRPVSCAAERAVPKAPLATRSQSTPSSAPVVPKAPAAAHPAPNASNTSTPTCQVLPVQLASLEEAALPSKVVEWSCWRVREWVKRSDPCSMMFTKSSLAAMPPSRC
jgi:hypothetical protein